MPRNARAKPWQTESEDLKKARRKTKMVNDSFRLYEAIDAKAGLPKALPPSLPQQRTTGRQRRAPSSASSAQSSSVASEQPEKRDDSLVTAEINGAAVPPAVVGTGSPRPGSAPTLTVEPQSASVRAETDAHGGVSMMDTRRSSPATRSSAYEVDEGLLAALRERQKARLRRRVPPQPRPRSSLSVAELAAAPDKVVSLAASKKLGRTSASAPQAGRREGLGEASTRSLTREQKRWSPVAEYEYRLATSSVKALLRVAAPSSLPNQRRAPAFSISQSKRQVFDLPQGAASTGPSPQSYDAVGAMDSLSTSKSAPAFSIGGRLTSPRTRAASLGYPTPPAPGYNIPTPSFARDDMVEGKGAYMGVKLKDRKEIERKLGIGQGPAPGGTIPMEAFSFVEQNKRERRGVVMGKRLPTQAEIDERLGASSGIGPGGSGRVPSFVYENRVENKGIVFGHRVKSEDEIAEACGFPKPPAPNEYTPYLDMAEENLLWNKGPTFGVRLKTMKEMQQSLGHPEPPAPGGNTKVPSFARDAADQNKGVRFASRIPTRDEIVDYLPGHKHTPAPGGTLPVSSFAEKNKKEKRGPTMGAGDRFQTRRDVNKRLGYPDGPPGGTLELPVPSFAEEAKRGNRGVRILGKLKDRLEIDEKLGIFHGPAPGGDIPVESFSFAMQDKKENKGVVFGHKLKDRREIDEKLGIFHGPAPGGDIPIESFSFAEQNKRAGRGVKMVGRLKSDVERALSTGHLPTPGPGQYDTARSEIGSRGLPLRRSNYDITKSTVVSPGPAAYATAPGMSPNINLLMELHGRRPRTEEEAKAKAKARSMTLQSEAEETRAANEELRMRLFSTTDERRAHSDSVATADLV